MADVDMPSLLAQYTRMERRDAAFLRAHFPGYPELTLSLSMETPGESFFDELAEGLHHGRRGEVVLVVFHADGRLWLHTKAFYPSEVYRLPSGGIQAEELAWDAAGREVREEMGMSLVPSAFLGLLRYRLTRQEHHIPFVSYLFRFEAGEAEPRNGDEEEAISGFRCIPPAELPAVACRLRALEGRWRDWGQFRALAHDVLYGWLRAGT